MMCTDKDKFSINFEKISHLKKIKFLDLFLYVIIVVQKNYFIVLKYNLFHFNRIFFMFMHDCYSGKPISC